jgi:hypothetical protein
VLGAAVVAPAGELLVAADGELLLPELLHAARNATLPATVAISARRRHLYLVFVASLNVTT